MDLNLYQKRLSAYGGNDKRAKLDYRNKKMLDKALRNSFNAEDVIFNGEQHRALMLDDKLTLDVDQKWFAMENDTQLEPGDVLHVLRNDSHWIMVQEDLNERSFKRCVGSRAVYEVSWRDDNDEIRTSWASLRGPTETSIKTESRKHLLFDQGNEKMMLFLPSKAETKNLKRYKFLMVEGETWEIASTDPYTTPGIMSVALVEAQNNPYSDNQELGIARDSEFELRNLFENDLSFGVNQHLSINPFLTKNGVDITLNKDDLFEFKCKNSQDYEYDTEAETVVFFAPGVYQVEMGYPKMGVLRNYEINVKTELSEMDSYYVIEGASKITPFKNDTQTYDIEYYINGVETPILSNGKWSINADYAKIIKQATNFVDIEFNGIPGQTKLEYLIDGQVMASLEITILTIFG